MIAPGLLLGRVAIGVALVGLWQGGTMAGALSPLFFGRPEKILGVIFTWFASGLIWPHLAVTLTETLLAFVSGTASGVVAGLWLGLSPRTLVVLDPFIKAANAMPRVILAPIFAMWFGLGMGSKVALSFTLVFFIVFFNVLSGVREVSPTVLNATRMLGASRQQLVRHVYLPAALSWVFSSLHVSIGMAFVGAVIAEYLGSAAGLGYLILQAEGVFDVDTVFAGIFVLTACALALDMLVSVAERRFLVWQPRAEGQLSGRLSRRAAKTRDGIERETMRGIELARQREVET
jgi:NitT/TauT family transport system permease protein